jgi:hypothetical protein
MSDTKDLEAVEKILSGLFVGLQSVQITDPEIFEDETFLKWALSASINLTSQLAKIGGLDSEQLLENIKFVLENHTKPLN